MDLLIRKMEQKDISSVILISRESWHETYDGIIPRNIQDNFLAQAYNENILVKRYQQTPFYVAELNNKIVGFANYSNINTDGNAELSAIYLLPNFKGRGIGSKLLEKGIQDLKSKSLFVEVESKNEIGKTFYTAKGFLLVKEFDDEFDGHILKTTRMVLKVK